MFEVLGIDKILDGTKLCNNANFYQFNQSATFTDFIGKQIIPDLQLLQDKIF